MNSRQVRRGSSELFARSVDGLTRARVRPEVHLGDLPAPQRIAPFSTALSAEVLLPGVEEPPASGRFIVLHDPDAPDVWDGSWRLVTYASARMEPELAADPLLGEVGWAWLTDMLDDTPLTYRALGGTVTRVVSESFGTLGDREPTVELEVRASWTAQGNDLGEHLRAWTDVLCTLAGLPPLPEGVTPLPGVRR
ncbi:MAG: DUF3000 domain-containing protein [Dermatophilaceae bacterium]